MSCACLECGKRLDASPQAGTTPVVSVVGPHGSGTDVSRRPGRSAEFCSRDCRNAFNNRRLTRGAELYDLVMAARFDRPLAKALKIWGWIARLATQYRDEDKRERAGRPSWRHPREIAARRPWITGRILDRGRAA